MSLQCGCPDMSTLLLLWFFAVAAAAAGPMWASPLPTRCGGTDCSHFASQRVRYSSPTLPAVPGLAILNHRSDNTFSALRPGTTDAAEMLRGLHDGKRDGSKRNNVPAYPAPVATHSLLRGETFAGSRHQTPSTSDVFSNDHLSHKLGTYFSRKDVEEVRAEDVRVEATTVSSVYSQKGNNERPFWKDVFLNKLYAGVTLNGRHWPERPGYRSNPKQKKETPAHLRNGFIHKSSGSYNWHSGGHLRRKSWKDYNSMPSTEQVPQMVKEQAVTVTSSVHDDVVSLIRSGATTEEQTDSESPRNPETTSQSANEPSPAQATTSRMQSHRSSAEGQLSRDYRPSGTPDTREPANRDLTAVATSKDISVEPTTLPSSVNEVDASKVDTGIIETPDSDLQEQQEEIEDAIVRDATLIIVFSCLAVASLVTWRIIRCIAMHKLKQHEKKLEAEKTSTV